MNKEDKEACIKLFKEALDVINDCINYPCFIGISSIINIASHKINAETDDWGNALKYIKRNKPRKSDKYWFNSDINKIEFCSLHKELSKYAQAYLWYAPRIKFINQLINQLQDEEIY